MGLGSKEMELGANLSLFTLCNLFLIVLVGMLLISSDLKALNQLGGGNGRI